MSPGSTPILDLMVETVTINGVATLIRLPMRRILALREIGALAIQGEGGF